MKKFLYLLPCLLLCSPAALALTFSESEFICPLDGHAFKQRVPMSGTSFGSMLDMQRYGPIQSPWEQPQCPRDGFVLCKYRNEELTEEEIAILRPFVLSPEYQAMRRTETPYWLIARCMEKLGMSLADRAWVLLEASWEANGSDRYPRYAREALTAQEALLAKGGQGKEAAETTRLLIGELNRRLGNFERAKAIFTALAGEPDFKNNRLYMRIIALQLKLIEAGDTASHQIPNDDQPTP